MTVAATLETFSTELPRLLPSSRRSSRKPPLPTMPKRSSATIIALPLDRGLNSHLLGDTHRVMSLATDGTNALAHPLSETGAVVSDKQHELGQFSSPRPVADLLASFVEFSGREVRMLEAGAGSGILIAAVVQRACEAERAPRQFFVDAWEVDEAVLPGLRRTLDDCKQRCATAGIQFEAHVHHGDFIEASIERVRDDWFAKPSVGYTLALLNPPYRKIRGASRERMLLRSRGSKPPTSTRPSSRRAFARSWWSARYDHSAQFL